MKYFHVKPCERRIGGMRGFIVETGEWGYPDAINNVSLLLSFNTKKFEYWIRFVCDVNHGEP
ncbi:MAG: hypothetical protein ACR2IJ_01545, partial [Fluviibacter sp.]